MIGESGIIYMIGMNQQNQHVLKVESCIEIVKNALGMKKKQYQH